MKMMMKKTPPGHRPFSHVCRFPRITRHQAETFHGVVARSWRRIRHLGDGQRPTKVYRPYRKILHWNMKNKHKLLSQKTLKRHVLFPKITKYLHFQSSCLSSPKEALNPPKEHLNLDLLKNPRKTKESKRPSRKAFKKTHPKSIKTT